MTTPTVILEMLQTTAGYGYAGQIVVVPNNDITQGLIARGAAIVNTDPPTFDPLYPPAYVNAALLQSFVALNQAIQGDASYLSRDALDDTFVERPDTDAGGQLTRDPDNGTLSWTNVDAQAATAVTNAVGGLAIPVAVDGTAPTEAVTYTDPGGRRLPWASNPDGGWAPRSVKLMRDQLQIPDVRGYSRHLGADTAPVFVRTNGNRPVHIVDASSSVQTLFWPCTHYIGNTPAGAALGYRYARTFSTDHDLTVGGVQLGLSNSPTGPWTDEGIVFRDPADGQQTEVFQWLWIPELGQFVAFYSQKGVAGQPQYIGRTTSTDLVNWTAPTYVQRMNTAQAVRQPYNGTQEYTSVWRRGGRLTMIHSAPYAGFRAGSVMAYSDDWGQTWIKEPGLYRGFGQAIQNTAFKISVNQVRPLMFRGVLWAVCPVNAAGTAGGDPDPNAYIVAFPMSPDFKQPLGPPSTIWTPSETWEVNAAGLSSIYLWSDPTTGYAYLDYVTGKTRLGTLVSTL